MNGGTKFLACSAMLLVAACVGEAGKLEVRSLPTPLAAGKKPVSFRVAEGHQQMAMNNVALALESYRRALREDPNSVDAHAGIAAGYDRMGRYDLARRSYEAALAIEPGNATVLAMLAASLDQQGKSAAATAVRHEIRQRLAAVAAPDSAPMIDNPPVELTAMAEAAAPPPQPPAVVADVEVPLPAPDLSAVAPALASTPLAVSLATIAPAAVVAAFAPDEPAAPAAPKPAPAKPVAVAEAAPPARSVTIKLPPPRPVAPPKAETRVASLAPSVAPVQRPVALPPALPQPVAPQPVAPKPINPDPVAPTGAAPVALAAAAKPSRPAPALPIASGRGPRLERASLGEVALITTRQPQWASFVVQSTQRSAKVRFVPLKEAGARFASVRLLNAARVRGLAARTRSTLFDRGWRGLAIGDANATRARSLVLYPAHRRTIALSLARQFGFAAAQGAKGNQITVLLGRDAATMVRRAPAG